jgi:hypothetical protein
MEKENENKDEWNGRRAEKIRKKGRKRERER